MANSDVVLFRSRIATIIRWPSVYELACSQIGINLSLVSREWSAFQQAL